MNFTVIDFETANRNAASACALGIVKVENGVVVEKDSWLIRPIDMKFDYWNIRIHKIRPEHVRNKPEFGELYKKIFREKLEGQLVVAHNAAFDMSVLRKSLDLYGMEYPTLDYLCTVKIAKRTWPELANHKLDGISHFLDFKFTHHDALDDSLACANALINACKYEDVDSPVELANKLNIKIGKLFPGGYTPCSSARR